MPIVTTLPGKNCVPGNHPLVMGPSGMHGRLEADAAIINADVVLAVGTRFSDRTVGNFSEFRKGKKIIHIDIDRSEVGKNVKPEVGIVGDAKTVLSMMIKLMPKALERRHDTFIKWLRGIKESYEKYRSKVDTNGFVPWKVLKVLREVMPPNSITATGVGSHQMWSELHWDVYVPGTFITSAGLGTMGFGIPAALGAKIARPDVPVLDIDGDGSFQMTMQNLALIREYNIPIIVTIFDNSTLMLVRHWQVMLYNRRIIAVDFNVNPDFMKIAEAYGIEGVRPGDYEELRSAVTRAVRDNEALIVDVTIDREKDFVLPFVPSGKWLEEVIFPEGFKVDLRYRVMAMESDFSIEIIMSNEINQFDAVVRAMNVIRRGKVTIRHVVIDMSDSVIKVSIRARGGEEDEVRWVCNKLDKLYDVVNVKYMPEEVHMNKMVVSNG